MNLQKVKKEFLNIIEPKLTPISYKTWIYPTRIRSIDEELKIIYMENSDSFKVENLNERYLTTIQESFEEVFNEKYRVVIKTKEEYEANKPIKEETSKKNEDVGKLLKTNLVKQRIFNPKYTFDNFVVGPSNQFAFNAALAVAESPSKALNPLFIYGGSGLGKTHLIHAIGIYLAENNPDLRVLFITSEMFTNELIKSLKENTSSTFKRKYRNIDVLIIDDIQFLAKKQSTQEELFYTFEDLYRNDKQIVITSDTHPSELKNFDERLKSRFSWNATIDITPADYETRVAILMKKAENNNMDTSDPDLIETIELISEKIKDNNRDLEGALENLKGFSTIMNEKITVDFAKRVLKDIILNGGNSITPEKIKNVVSRKYNVKVSDLESKSRLNKFKTPRQVAMYLIKRMTDFSFEKIGKMFGDKHYSTVIHACNKIADDMKVDKEFRKEIEILIAEIED